LSQSLLRPDAPLGTHLIADFFGASRLDELEFVRAALTRAALAAGAQILRVEMHAFATGGVTGIVLLAESHLSIHTWPEYGIAAVDVFMCGDALALKALKSLETSFLPSAVSVKQIERGV
jgi:S-adenosylmethionine decarboxylase